MKKSVCLLLTLIMLLSLASPVTASATSFSFRVEEVYVPAILDVLKDHLLVPSSLSLRDVGVIPFHIEDSPSYYFFAIHYVAQNKIGGYSDDWIYAISTTSLEDQKVAVMDADRDIFVGTSEMMSTLTTIFSDYIFKTDYYRSNSNWQTLSCDISWYDMW